MVVPISPRQVVVVGSGSFARSICHSLAAWGPPAAGPLRVTVLARNLAVAEEIAHGGRLRAAVAGTGGTFAAEQLAGPDGELDMLARLRPDVLVCCASSHSPYERITRPSPWTGLLYRAGFGVTLPFQATLTARLARAVAAVSPATTLINGCFPDAVNPLLGALGLPVHCGIGNVATVAACLQAALELPDQRDLAVLGYHGHLVAPTEAADEVLAWLGGSPVPEVTELLAPARALPRAELNTVGGHAAARLIVDLLSGVEIHTSLPGPLGLPGGYPVRMTGRAVELNLPAGVDRNEAVAWNIRAGLRNGIKVADGRVTYAPVAAEALAYHAPDIAAGWPVEALDDVATELTTLRRRLRQARPVQV